MELLNETKPAAAGKVHEVLNITIAVKMTSHSRASQGRLTLPENHGTCFTKSFPIE